MCVSLSAPSANNTLCVLKTILLYLNIEVCRIMTNCVQRTQVTPKELIKILRQGRKIDCHNYNHWDEIIPGLFLGDSEIAKNVWKLQKGNVTHILNAVHKIPCEQPTSFFALGIDEKYYRKGGLIVDFKGIPVLDDPEFPIDQFFDETSEFIHSALKSDGKVLVHCILGRSRAATLVIAYLMIKKNLSAEDAVKVVSQRRNILPNLGFLKQLCKLDSTLSQKRKRAKRK